LLGAQRDEEVAAAAEGPASLLPQLLSHVVHETRHTAESTNTAVAVFEAGTQSGRPAATSRAELSRRQLGLSW
jgi:hypothetical protein